MDPQTILTIFLVILCFNYALDKSLDFLNLRRLSAKLPESLTEFYDESEYKRSQAYLRTKMRFAFISSTISFVGTIVVLATGFLGTVNGWLAEMVVDPVWLSLAFFGVLFIVMDIFGTPFSLYNTFVIEERFGFNKTTLRTFFLDKIKGYFLGILLGGGILFLLISLINWLQADFWLWFWLAITVILLLFQYFFSRLFLPLFHKMTPLEAGELRTAIETYAEENGFPVGNIMVIDGSKRSTKANAMFSGFGRNKRVLLYDTLIEQMTVEELVAILAHEIGHYKRRHIFQGVAISVLNMGIMLFILSRLVLEPSLSQALGADVPGIHLSLIAFGLLYAPISQISGILFNLLSRKNEYEADDFARKTSDGAALRSALAKLHVKTLSNLQPHPAYVFVHYSHPTLVQRLAALKS